MSVIINGKGEITYPKPEYPFCECKNMSVKKFVSKKGPNKGRPFYTCAEQVCKFFRFADLEIEESPTGPSEVFILVRMRQRTSEPQSKSTIKFTPKQTHFKLQNNWIEVKFSYDHVLVEAFKAAIPGRKWEDSTKCWLVPINAIHDMITFFKSTFSPFSDFAHL